MVEITDPDLLTQLGASSAPSGIVTDPDLLKQLNAGQSEQPSVAADVAKSGGVGLAKGAIAGIGAPGDLSDLLSEGSKAAADYIGGKLGLEKSPELGPAVLPTSGDIQHGVEGVTGEFYKPQTTAGKYAQTTGEFLGNPTTYLGPGSMLAKGATAVGGALGTEAATQATENSTKPWVKALAPIIGAIAGGHAVTSPTRIITPLPSDAERAAQVAAIRGEGITPTAGQITGSEALRRAENVAPSIPFGPRGTNERINDQFTQAALSRAGIDSTRATPEAMQAGADRLGAIYNRVAGRNNMQMDQQLQNDLLDTVSNYANNVRPPLLPTIENTMNEAANLAGRQGDQLTGQQYLTLRSRLRASARGESDPQTRDTLNDMATHFDDAMERSITHPEDAGALAQANQRYRNMMVLERAASMGGEQGAQGVITPGSLAAAVKGTEGRRAFVRGTGDLSALARNGQAILTKTNSSGTAENTNILKWLGAESPIIAAIGAESPDMLHTLGAAAVGLAVPSVGARLMMSSPIQRYLANQVLPYRFETSPSTVALMNAIRGNSQAPQITNQGQR